MTVLFEDDLEMLRTPITEPLEVGQYYIVRMPGLHSGQRMWLGTNTERKWVELGVVFKLPWYWYESPWRKLSEDRRKGVRLAKI